MAKKVRKPRSANPRTFGQSGPQPAQPAPPVQAATATRPADKPAAAVAPKSGKQIDLRAEYPYVNKDLRNLGITAAAMFAVLIVLNLVLNFVR